MDWFVIVMEIDSLLSLKKLPRETLHSYAKRYRKLFNKIENCNLVVFVSSFKLGLTPDDE